MTEDTRTAIVVDGTAIAALVASFVTRGTAYVGPELCLVKRVFHVRCAGCGLMRSFAAVWEGSFAEAFHMHAFGPVLFAGLLAAPLLDLGALAFRKPLIVPRLLTTNAFRVLVILGVLATLALPFQDVR